MSGLRLFTGNRLERLSAVLADVLKSSPLPPFHPETFVVQSNGMERWVSMEIAKHLGISANNRFLYPNTFIHDMMSKVVPLDDESSGFTPEVMTWRILKHLPGCLDEPAFKDIRHYLGDSLWDRKSYQLASKIADIYDQYLLFRPEMIFDWENGDGDLWQAVLWRKLVEEEGKDAKVYHKAGLLKQFMENVKTAKPESMGFPERISVFGISALPQFHMSVLGAISGISNVYLYLLNPCREYWGDVLSEREMKRISAKSSGEVDSHGLLHLDSGNRLLSDFGVLGRDFFDLIQEYDCETDELFEEPGEHDLLSCIQSDILHLTQRPDKDGKKEITADDHSVIVNSCHSPMREVEILYDYLLDFFNNDPSLTPGDILVMTPDIESYTPYIQAVFDVPENETKRIPYSIADRMVLNESNVISAFNSLLDLCGSRFGISQVLSFLEASPVREKFCFSKNDLILIEKWVSDTGIKWGVDGAHRRKMALPGFNENTWRAGLNQLLLGYAVKGDGKKTFQGMLPYDEMEGENSLVMGRFVNFIEKLVKLVSTLEKTRTPGEWCRLLNITLDDFFFPELHTEKEFLAIRRAAELLKDVSEAAGVKESIGLDIVRQHLAQIFGKEGFGFGFLEGGVTFCAMVPMRSIPFKVICLMGMNSDAYPRQTRSPGFDLIAKAPRQGDRSRRNDDQYLFLESILSARNILYISYEGQSRIDNTSIPPAVPLCSLLDYIEENYEIPGVSIKQHVVNTHRLQGFNPEYFTHPEKLFSYSEVNKKISEDMFKKEIIVRPFINTPGIKPEDGKQEAICRDLIRTADLEDIIRFFRNPSEYYIKHRIGIFFDNKRAFLEEREAFSLDPLERYLLETELVQASLDHREPSHVMGDLKAAFTSRGRLPHGKTGDIVFTETAKGAMAFAETVSSFSRGKIIEPLSIDISIGDFHLTGNIGRSDGDRIVMYRNASIKAKDLLKIWIYHLALNCLDVEEFPHSSIFVGRDERKTLTAIEFTPVESSYAKLENLLGYYRNGLMSPIYFYPETSLYFATRLAEGKKTPGEILREAKKNWEGNAFTPGESENPYYELCFRGIDPFSGEFEKSAVDIFAPLLANSRKYAVGQDET